MKQEEACQAIKELIFSNRLVPGQKIIYRDLEEKLGMSKTPIINGLIKLEEEGLMVSKMNRGFYVKEENVEEASQIFEVREKLEEIAIDFALENFHAGDLKVLEEKLIAYKNYSSPIYDRKRLDLDIDFHMQIAEMGGNQYFAELIGRFYENIYFRLNLIYLSPRIVQFGKEHEQMFNAIKAKNTKEAKRIVRFHTRAGKRLVFEKKYQKLSIAV